MAVKINRTLVLLLEPKVETKSSIFLCKDLLNSLFILYPAGEGKDTANGRAELEFTGRPPRFRLLNGLVPLAPCRESVPCAPRPPQPALRGARGHRRASTGNAWKGTAESGEGGAKSARWHTRQLRHRRINFTPERVCEAALTATEMELLQCFIILENDFCLC